MKIKLHYHDAFDRIKQIDKQCKLDELVSLSKQIKELKMEMNALQRQMTALREINIGKRLILAMGAKGYG